MALLDGSLDRRDFFKVGAAAVAVAASAGIAGCNTASAAPYEDTSKAANGVATVTLEESVSDNVLSVEVTKQSVNLINGIVYKQVSGASCTQLTMDVLIPGGDGPFPAVLFFNGGGFTASDPNRAIVHRMAFANAGYVVASIKHRVTPSSQLPEPIEDAKAAVRYLRANADTYHIDTEHIGVLGSSAGGYFASMLGTTGDVDKFDTGDNLDQSSAVQAVIDLYGVSDLTIIGAGLDEKIEQSHHSPATTEALLLNGTAFGDNQGSSVFDTLDKAAEYSPFTYIDGTDAPFLLMHGDKDTLVSPVATMELYKRLKDAGVEAERYVIAGAGHGGPVFEQDQLVGIMVEFLDKHLKLPNE